MSCCSFTSNNMFGDWERLGPQPNPRREGILEDKNTGDTYNKDDCCLIRFKCGAIMIGNAIRTVFQIIYDVCSLAWNILKIFTQSIWNFIKELVATCKGEDSLIGPGEKASIGNAFKLLGKGFCVDLPSQFAHDLKHVFLDPLCLIAIEAIAAYGLLFDPYNARKMIGKIERYGINDGLRYDQTGSFYLAPCFQCRSPGDPEPVHATTPLTRPPQAIRA